MNAISPGPIDTPGLHDLGSSDDASYYVKGIELFVDGGVAQI